MGPAGPEPKAEGKKAAGQRRGQGAVWRTAVHLSKGSKKAQGPSYPE